MKKFFSNCKGAVTVLVTLLLVPSILVSGTAVDAARIYTTRNAVQNANQLAANASLASYNSLLKDLYALYGFMQEDPQLAAMIDEYIQITIYGKDEDKGTFRSFIGSNEFTTELEYTGNLRKTDVLKQQILEYMKFRGPAIILDKIFGGLGSGTEHIEHDSDILDVKQEIDDSLEDILAKYKQLYYAIMQSDSCRDKQGPTYTTVCGNQMDEILQNLQSIRDDFGFMEEIRIKYESTIDPEKKGELSQEYRDIIDDIRKKANNIDGAVETIRTHTAPSYSGHFTNVVKIAAELDQMRESLKGRVEDLRRRLTNGECSPGIYSAFMDPPPDEPGGKPLIDRYDEILKTEVSPMAVRYKNDGVKYIDELVMPALEDPLFIRYRDSKVTTTDENSLTLDELRTLSTNPDFYITSDTNKAAYFAGLTDLPPEDPDYVDFLNLDDYMPKPFYRFGSNHFPDDQVQFWKDLEKMVTGGGSQYVDLFSNDGVKTGSESSEKEQRKQLDALKKRGDDDDDNNADNLGAQWVDDPEWTHTNENVNWGSLPKNVIKLFKSPKDTFRQYRDFALVLTYDMSMFSNYTTTKPNKGPEYSIPGVKMNRNVNYYYQSEWEYLLVGKQNASDNLSRIKSLIKDIRLILNFIAVWSISEINQIVALIRALPIPFGIPFVLGEVARLGFWLYESKIDVDRLRKGYKVAMFKNNSNWLCKPSTFWRLPGNFDDDGVTFSYENYLTVFFVAKAMILSSPENATNVLVNRTADLIEWNVNNYQQGIGADEKKMQEHLNGNDGVFRMKNAATTFSISTTVEMRMLFLSMPFAQKGVNGVIPPRTLPITITDFRGY